MKRTFPRTRGLLVTALLTAILLPVFSASAQTAVPTPRTADLTPPQAQTITVVGEGSVKVKPDIAQTTVGVEVVGPTAQQASEAVSATMDKVLSALKEQGIAENDIQTSGYNIWVERPSSPEGRPTDEVIYHVSNQASITVRDLTKIGSVLDAAIAVGANNIYGVTFDLSDKSSIESQARAKALDNARGKAEEFARLTGTVLGPVIAVSEVIPNNGVFVGGLAKAMEGQGGGGGPVAPGELELSLQLQIVYSIH